MDIFNYHPQTGEFLGIGTADPNPVNPDNPIIPGFATTIEPPTPSAGHVPVFRDGAWGEEQDHRGEVWWTPEGVEMTVQQIGDPATHGLLKEPPTPQEEPSLAKIRFALCLNGVVVQTLDLETGAKWALADGYMMRLDDRDEARIGYLYDDVNQRFTAPPEGSAA